MFISDVFPAPQAPALAGCRPKFCRTDKMYQNSMSPGGRPQRYSAKRMEKPVNFICIAPDATTVQVIGDFNQWRTGVHPMTRRPDGAWFVAIPMHHGHHRYVFVVDDEKRLDPEAQGIARNERNERVSLISVS